MDLDPNQPGARFPDSRFIGHLPRSTGEPIGSMSALAWSQQSRLHEMIAEYRPSCISSRPITFRGDDYLVASIQTLA
jgi:hypothetical protein